MGKKNKIKEKATGVRGREQTEATAGKIARSSQEKKTSQHVAASSAPHSLFRRTALCCNQRITGRSDQTLNSGLDGAADGWLGREAARRR